ncbi:hypothetical protein LguiB_033018 [Lonicera macranthoides]
MRNFECLTWGIGKERVLRGRTAVEIANHLDRAIGNIGRKRLKKGNRVYFTDCLNGFGDFGDYNEENVSDVGVFSLEDGTFNHCPASEDLYTKAATRNSNMNVAVAITNLGTKMFAINTVIFSVNSFPSSTPLPLEPRPFVTIDLVVAAVACSPTKPIAISILLAGKEQGVALMTTNHHLGDD